VYAVQFGGNRFILAETITIFRNSSWRPPPSWILENSHICPKGSIKVCARCMLLKFGENRFTLAETIIYFEIQDGGRRHLGFLKIRIFILGDRYRLVPSVCCSNLVGIASFVLKLLIFLEIQDDGRRHLGFWKTRISILWIDIG